MGMAASQARYLTLIARQSNLEYEGQQINQARTALSNQSANLFNQMLGLTVPTPPSTQDYTTTQYSYNDGTNSSVITSWQQLSTADPNYNYVVTHSYNTNKFTGSLKKLSDPQVKYSGTGVPATDQQIKDAMEEVNNTKQLYEAAQTSTATAKANYNTAVSNTALAEAQLETATAALTKAKTAKEDRTNYASDTGITVDTCIYDEINKKYTVTDTASPAVTTTYTEYDSLSNEEKTNAKAVVQKMIDNGAITEADLTKICYDETNKTVAFKEDLEKAKSDEIDELPIYKEEGVTNKGETLASDYTTASDDKQAAKEAHDNAVKAQSQALELYNAAVTAEETAKQTYEQAVDAYEALNHPTYVGNCELTPLADLTDSQVADIRQIVSDMNEQGIECNITDCYNTTTDTYYGGIYTYTMNGKTYYTTLADLNESYNSTQGSDKPLEGQTKLTYYNADYISTKVEKTEKALLETDGSGRFTTVKFEDDSVTYTLSVETVTDDNAYQDAMNQYYYDNAVYDKTVQDINAKTSIIQQEDQQLELKLKQLDTERNALTNEIEAVQKVVKDAVESGFKTFGG